jgi:hypothetical protein
VTTPAVASDVPPTAPAAAPTTVAQTPYDLVKEEQPKAQVAAVVETPTVAKEG